MLRPVRFCWFWCIALLLGLVRLSVAGEPTAAPILRIESGTHVTQVTRIAADRGGRFLASGSYDQTIRLWSLPKLELMRTIRLPIDVEREGAVYGLALSPDGTTLAAGGWTGGWDGEGNWCVYLLSVADGSLLRSLCGLPHRVMDLAFSPDGRFLAVTMKSGRGLRVYRTEDYSIALQDTEYGDSSNWVEFDGKGRLITAALDGKVRLYDPQLRRIAVRAMPEGRIPFTATFSPDGTKVAVAYGEDDTDRVGVIDVISGEDLSPLFRPDLRGVDNGHLSRAAWSADGRNLYAGGSFQKNGRNPVRRWSDGGRGPGETLRAGAPDRILDFVALRQGGLAFCGMFPHIGLLGADDRIETERRAALADYRGLADGLAISSDGLSVQFAFETAGAKPAHFLLAERTLTMGAAPGAEKFARTRFKAPGIEIKDWDGGFRPSLNGRPIPLDNYEQSLSLAIDNSGGGFVLGTIWRLRRFAADGRELWSLTVPAPVYALASTPDGRLLVAAHGDGTVRWYALKDGRWLGALFPHPDEKRWIAWTPSGFYAASVGGDGLIGWHVNRGRNKTADFFPAGRFRDTYYRPDVVLKSIELLGESNALKRVGSSGAQPKDVTELLPPVIEIEQPADGGPFYQIELPVSYRVRTPSGEPVTEIRVLRDGRQVGAAIPAPPAKGDFSGDLLVLAPRQSHELTLLAVNRRTVSEPSRVRLNWSGRTPVQQNSRPNLYLLAIGVADYPAAQLKLGYPAKDARDFANTFRAQEGRAFGKVTVRVLPDSEATRTSIESGLDWLQKNAGPEDMAIVFLAGHGVDDPAGYHYLPYDVDMKRPAETGLSYTRLRGALGGIRANVALFIDTCHSGDVFGRKGRASMDVNRLVNDLASAEHGIIVFAASTGEQVAFESSLWGNGAFTKAVIEGLGGEAAYRGRPYISAGMLDVYVSERVKELTAGEQTPVSAKPLTLPDFQLSLINK